MNGTRVLRSPQKVLGFKPPSQELTTPHWVLANLALILGLSLRREDVVGGSWTIHPEGQRGDVEREILVRQLLSGLGRFVPYSDRAGRRRILDFSRRLSEAYFPGVPTASLFQPFLYEWFVISKQS